MTPDLRRLHAALEATWPAASRQTTGPWTIRDGQGGGKRVSAASANGLVGEGDIATAEAVMKALGQTPLFMIRAGDEALDEMLSGRGYVVVDPVVIYLAPVADLAEAPPPVSALPAWPPLAVQTRLWVEAGIGPGRLAVMERVRGAKTTLLARMNDRAAGTAFVALDHDIAMVHALEVVPTQRRQGTARNMMRGAAVWAQDHGAEWLGVVVTRANEGARALYTSLGMQGVGQYHYRSK